MSNSQQSDQAKKQYVNLERAKPMLASVLGAIIGCGASLHMYYTLLGGAEQNQRLVQVEASVAQVESTVEHNRMVGEQILAALMQNKADRADHAARGGDALSNKPTQRELSDALEGLFEKLPDQAEPVAAESVPTEPADQAQTALASGQKLALKQAVAKAFADEGVAADSDEPAKK